MKRIISIVFIVLGCVSLTTGVVFRIIEQNNQNKALASLKASIVEDYETFKVKIESFSTERTSVYEGLNKITYLTELPNNYENLVNEYTKYENTVKDIEESSKDLKENCFKQEYNETEITNKVSAFTINYEQAVNYYIQDVEKFNEKIRSYNDWVQNTQVTNTYKTLEEFKSSYIEYVDINGDGIYNGVNNK